MTTRAVREIVKIYEEKCDGCGDCVMTCVGTTVMGWVFVLGNAMREQSSLKREAGGSTKRYTSNIGKN